MKRVLMHDTSAGPVFIVQAADGRYLIEFQDERAGYYDTAQRAIDDACGNHQWSLALDLSKLELSPEVADWRALIQSGLNPK